MLLYNLKREGQLKMNIKRTRLWRHATGSEAGLPGSGRGYENRGKRKAGLGLHSASPPLGDATPRHHTDPQVILPTMHRQISAWCNIHTHVQHTHIHTLSLTLSRLTLYFNMQVLHVTRSQGQIINFNHYCDNTIFTNNCLTKRYLEKQ